MKVTILKLAMLLAAIAIVGQLMSCDKLNNIEGTIAGQVTDSSGSPMGFMSIAVIDETGAEITRQTTNNEGGYFIGELKGGTYDLQVWNMGTQEMIITSGNATDIKLGPGRTLTIDLVVEYPEK